MKNKTILAIIIIIISVLVGLSIIYYVSSSITFTRKKECSKLRVQIEEYILKHRTDDLDNAQRYVGLDEVFYSPKLNSCMYTMVR
jgi:uncharacterized protein YpmB